MQEIAFRIGNLTVHWYGILVAIGFMAGVYTAGLRGRRDNINSERITDMALWIFGGAFLGARILFVITFWEQEFVGKPWYRIFALRAGFVFYGGL
ncbi:MAG: prolipoprotein diacylglyceryl transferase family protein, partial [Limisphaerales bacterium]